MFADSLSGMWKSRSGGGLFDTIIMILIIKPEYYLYGLSCWLDSKQIQSRAYLMVFFSILNRIAEKHFLNECWCYPSSLARRLKLLSKNLYTSNRVVLYLTSIEGKDKFNRTRYNIKASNSTLIWLACKDQDNWIWSEKITTIPDSK